MGRLWGIVGAALALALGAVAPVTAWAQAEKRVALVIGNAAYKEAPLKNPVNDARLMAARLKALGFDVIARENATREQMGAAIGEFGSRLAPGTVALVYYAGHGIQARGRNYMIPVDAALNTESDLRFQAVDIGALTEEIEQAQSRVSFLILDACRNNPFERRLRGAARGLAVVDAARGALIAYATAPGSVAADGDSQNGTYTEELAKALLVPNLKAEEVFKRVTATVEERTKGAQTPWISSSLRGDFIFNMTVNVAPAPSATAAPADREALFWSSAQASNRAEEYEEYLKQFPQGMFAGLARARIAALKTQPQIAAAPAASAVAKAPEVAVDPIDKEYVATQSARLREAPDVKAKQLATLKEGDALLVLGKVKGQPWYQVERKGEAPAYVSAGLVEEAAAYKKRQEAASQQQAMVAPTISSAPPASGALPAPGRSFRDCPDCPEMVVIPAGSFTMGDRRDWTYYGQNRVSIGYAFAAGKYEVTFAEWDACVAAGGCAHKPEDRGWGRGRQPVMNVSWDDAKQYVAWLSQRTGKQYRLLSEAEWEYAARAGRGGDVGGERELKGRNLANCDGCGSQWDNRQTAPVGSFSPNGFGLHDMLGNVWEWVEDCWNEKYVGAPGDGRPWLSGDCGRRVLRGGSWYFNPDISLASSRLGITSSFRDSGSGFRVARTN